MNVLKGGMSSNDKISNTVAVQPKKTPGYVPGGFFRFFPAVFTVLRKGLPSIYMSWIPSDFMYV